MRIPIQNPVKKITILAAGAIFAFLYVGMALTEFLAAHFANTPTLTSLHRAVWLQPGNAEYQYRVGRYFSLVETSPEQAAQAFRTAVALNPYRARYWFALAGTYQLLGDTTGQGAALEHALAVEPTTPEVAWEAANFYIVQGDVDAALKNLRVVLSNDPYFPASAITLCWRIRPDIDFLLQDIVPPLTTVNSALLEFLITKNETAASIKVWQKLVALNQPVERRFVFEYVRYLVGKQEPGQAHLVWEQAANLSGLVAYQESAENLVVNGDFSQEILNAGFDWLYHKSSDVSLTLDPTQFHTGHASLHLEFDSRGLEDAGIRQLISVKPSTAYQFSGYYKAEAMEGAGGLRFAIQDLYTAKTYLTSENFDNVDFWKQVGGTFTTDPDTKLLVLRIQREPARSPIKGKLWVDNLHLTPIRAQEGAN
jgi:tetratricopeptide (TPR) repeat protein